MKWKLFLLTPCLILCLSAADRRASFNDGWRFFKGEAAGAEQPAFDDSAWRQVQLPHDWAIEGPFDPKYRANAGGLPFFGVGWYRKRFTVPASEKGKCYSIEFDGAMSNSEVWLNGRKLGGRPYGYIGFGFDLPIDRQENVIAVRLAPEDLSSRWYPGAGIYRNVWLDATDAVHVARHGTYVTTPAVSRQSATIAVKTQVRNRRTTPAPVTVETSVIDRQGRQVASTTSRHTVPGGTTQTTDAKLRVANPQLWDVDRPYLYTVVTVIRQEGRERDRYTTPFGIRTIAFDAAKGFLLNGRQMKLKGVCMHHDLGALGAAVNRRATERQLQIMKSMGVNAIRTSHNPPSPEQLEYCDRLGLVVMDEAFDVWRKPKVANGYNKHFDKWAETDLRDFIRRDRNHPSVFLWSIGNEILEQSSPEGGKLARWLTDICHQEDPTRLTTAGFNNWDQAIKNELAANVDIPGFNYKPMFYERILRDHPKWIIAGAETSSCVSSRGVYHLPIAKYEKHPSLQLTSYDVIAPPWAYAPDVELDAQDRLPNVLGEFVWTGFDYLGEPTPFGREDKAAGVPKNPDWPSRSSYFGIVDLAGFPKDRFYLYQSVWTAQPMVHILPHWNWEDRRGAKIPVMAYSNCDQVELFLNGRSLGRKQRGAEPVEIPVGPNVSKDLKFKTKYRLLWEVPYEPGILRAVGYKQGAAAASKDVRTAGTPARLSLSPDRAVIKADGEDLSFITVRVEDKDGNLCPSADNLVRFKLEGPGRIAGVDNGNAASVEPFQADSRKAFSGLCLLIVRTERGKSGQVRMTATASGLRTAETSLTAQR